MAHLNTQVRYMSQGTEDIEKLRNHIRPIGHIIIDIGKATSHLEVNIATRDLIGAQKLLQPTPGIHLMERFTMAHSTIRQPHRPELDGISGRV